MWPECNVKGQTPILSEPVIYDKSHKELNILSVIIIFSSLRDDSIIQVRTLPTVVAQNQRETILK